MSQIESVLAEILSMQRPQECEIPLMVMQGSHVVGADIVWYPSLVSWCDLTLGERLCACAGRSNGRSLGSMGLVCRGGGAVAVDLQSRRPCDGVACGSDGRRGVRDCQLQGPLSRALW